jgi:hypothetical protein
MDEKVIYQILKKENPTWSETKLRNTAKQIIDNPQILEGGLAGGLITRAAATKLGKYIASTSVGQGVAQGAKAITGLAKTAKKPTKKQALLGGAALGVGGLAFSGGGESGTPDVAAQANADLMFQAAQYEAAGGDINALAQTAAGQQLFKNPNFSLGSIINSGSVFTGTSGVYTGKPVTVSQYEWGSGGARPKTTITDTVPLSDWKNQFPIADPKALAAWKAKLVSAGVVSASAGLNELKQQWEAWGQYSQDMNKQGKKLTPDQLLDIQRGLWGGGGGGKDYSTQYQVNLLKEENVKAMYKEAREQETGRIVSDEQAAAFVKRIKASQMAKPTKTEYKKIKGKMTPVTTPGFGEAETAAAAIELAKKDPMYAEFQTANVFGSALEKALGVRG